MGLDAALGLFLVVQANPSAYARAFPTQRRPVVSYDSLPVLRAEACGADLECAIYFELLAALHEPVAACHHNVVQVYGYAQLQKYWLRFAGRGYTTPRHMPISALYRMVGAHNNA